jgi:hypothetical protein
MAKIFGLVIDVSGKPIVQVRVTFADKNQQNKDERKTSAVGRYVTLDLKPGDYKWTAEKQGFMTRTGAITLKEGEPRVENEPIILEQPASISGHVIGPANARVKGAQVQAVDDKKVAFGPVATDANGAYSIINLTAGEYLISVQPPKRFRKPNPEKASAIPGKDTTVDFQLELAVIFGSISGRVTDRAGAAVNGATVKTVDARNRDSGVSNTDANGEYKIENLRAGNHTVSVTAPAGFQNPPPRVVAVKAGADANKTDFKLDAAAQGSTISGRVSDRQGNGVQGRDVRATNPEGQIAGRAQTGVDGRYEIINLAEAVYTVDVAEAANQPRFQPAHNVEVLKDATTTGIDFSEDVVADLIGRLDDARFGIESRISEGEADQAISLFSVVNLMLASLNLRRIGDQSKLDVLGMLNLYYSLQEDSLREQFVFGNLTTLWSEIEGELKELARDLDRLQSDIDFLNREARRQFNLGLSNSVLGNLRFPALFRRYIEIGNHPLLSLDIKSADQPNSFVDKMRVAQADELLIELKGLILQIVRSLSKYGTAATRRLNEDWARFESRALEILQTVARERVTPDRDEQNSWAVLADLTGRDRETEVAPYVALARHGGKLLKYATAIYRETKDQLDNFDPGHLRDLFQRGNIQNNFWTERIRSEATVIVRYPLPNWG